MLVRQANLPLIVFTVQFQLQLFGINLKDLLSEVLLTVTDIPPSFFHSLSCIPTSI